MGPKVRSLCADCCDLPLYAVCRFYVFDAIVHGGTARFLAKFCDGSFVWLSGFPNVVSYDPRAYSDWNVWEWGILGVLLCWGMAWSLGHWATVVAARLVRKRQVHRPLR
jgi:hypothetical protein